MIGQEQLDPGPVGIWTFAFEQQPAARVREAAAEVEELGYGAIWFGENTGREAFTQAALLLGATTRTVVATGIAQIRKRTAASTAAAQRTLAEAFPNRFLLGLGGTLARNQAPVPGVMSNPDTEPRIHTLRDYLDELDAAPLTGPAPTARPRRVLAALGPKMLKLAAERSWGAHPYFVPVEHTAQARAILGPDAFLGVEQKVILDTDVERARQTARATIGGYLIAAHQTNNLRRLGFDDSDLTGGPSDRLVDAIVAYRGVDEIGKRVREHLDAGANHVCVQVLTADPMALPLPEWRELAPALL